LRLDERTLAPALRQSVSRSNSSIASIEPCRLNPETPLRLSPATR
jgi:hypothetical protein